MICNSCAHDNIDSAAFCVSCGSPFITAPAMEEPAHGSIPQPVEPRSRKKLLVVLSSIGIAVALGLFIFVPRSYAVNVEVDAVNGGVFTEDCQLTSAGLKLLSVKAAAAQPGSASETRTIEEIAWESERGNCVGKTNFQLSPWSPYEITVGDYSVGDIEAGGFFGGTVDGFAKVAVERKISLAFDLTVDSSYCTGSMSSWTCYGAYGFYSDSDKGICHGEGGYSDIKSGAVIVISGNSNGKDKYGKLQNGTDWSLDSISSAKMTCHLKSASITVPNDDEGYAIEVSDRGVVNFTNADLEANGWIASVQLGD